MFLVSILISYDVVPVTRSLSDFVLIAFRYTGVVVSGTGKGGLLMCVCCGYVGYVHRYVMVEEGCHKGTTGQYSYAYVMGSVLWT